MTLKNSRNFSSNLDEFAIKFPSAKDFSALDDDKKRKLIEFELKYLRESGEFHVPSNSISNSHWPELLQKNSISSRKSYYKYLKSIETKQAKKIQKSKENQLKILERTEEINSNTHLVYGLWRNSFSLKLNSSSMTRHYNHNLSHAAMFGQKIIFDMGYSSHMCTREMKSCCDQLQNVFGVNKCDSDPFDLFFCNMPDEGSEFTQRVLSALPQLRKKDGLTKVTEKSYLDLFPKEKLVYLCPDCRTDLVDYSFDDVYIIGGLVDRGPSKPLSRSKAEKENIRMARLPLERYLDWGMGNKSLTLDQLMKIMLTMKNTRDWNAALGHVPRRKVR